MSELMSKAVTEGIEMPGSKPESKPEVVKDAKEGTPSATPTEQTPPVGEQPAQTPVVQPKERFEDNPGFKNVLRQRDSFKSELQKAQELNQKLMDLLENKSKPAQQQIANNLDVSKMTPEEAQAYLRQALGIEEISETVKQLNKRNAEFSKRETDSAFDKEEERINEQCKKFGLDVNTVVPELQNWLDSHPYFGKLAEYQPGFYDIAFKALYFDKSTELAKKAAYAEQLKETQKLKTANSESPNPGGTPSAPVYTGMKDKIKSLIEAGGGISFPGH